MNRSISRRDFVGSMMATASVWSMPRFAIGKSGVAANSKLNVACVGIGHMGSAAVKAAKKENLVALCDVDWRKDEAIWGNRMPAQFADENPQAKKFNDFRQMLDRMGNEIDVVLVSTPDHTHYCVAMAAMQLGKHVFVQKPLAHNIWQVRTLQKAMARHKVQTVMGNQGHTSDGIRRVKEWFEAGILGEVREVHCWTDRPCAPWFIKPQRIPPAGQTIPAGLDWDLWQGPVPSRNYSSDYVTQRWRGWWDYGVGALGDIGCHCLDAPFWALRLGMPTAVDVELEESVNDQYTPFGAHVVYDFPARGDMPPVKLHWWEGEPKPRLLEGMQQLPSNGMYMIGAKETLFHADMRPNKPTLWPAERMHDYRDIMTEQTIPRVQGGPFEELFRAVKGDGPTPGSNFDYAAPLTEVVLLGGLAIRTGRRIEWDAKEMWITNQPDSITLVNEPVRKGWSYGEEL